MEKEKVAAKRLDERQKRTFTDAGINIMTIDGARKMTQTSAQEYKEQMNADKM